MSTARQRSPPCTAAAASRERRNGAPRTRAAAPTVAATSDLFRDDARHHLPDVGSGSVAGGSLQAVFVEDLVVDHVTEAQLPLHRPVGEALLGAQHDIRCVAGVGPETPRDHGDVEFSTAELRVLAVHELVQLQQFPACPPGVASFVMRYGHDQIDRELPQPAEQYT